MIRFSIQKLLSHFTLLNILIDYYFSFLCLEFHLLSLEILLWTHSLLNVPFYDLFFCIGTCISEIKLLVIFLLPCINYLTQCCNKKSPNGSLCQEARVCLTLQTAHHGREDMTVEAHCVLAQELRSECLCSAHFLCVFSANTEPHFQQFFPPQLTNLT